MSWPWSELGLSGPADLAAATGDLELTERLVLLGAQSFQATHNDRAWFRAKLRLAQIKYDAKRVAGLAQEVQALVRWCELAEGVNDPKKESLLLEVLALQMQCVVAESGERQGVLRRLVARAQSIQTAIPHPRTVGNAEF